VFPLRALASPSDEAIELFRPADWRYTLPRDAVASMQAQRAKLHTWPTGDQSSVIGCVIQHTTVTREAITTRIVHRWPDKLGHSITGLN
jgi:hypothetical protein